MQLWIGATLLDSSKSKAQWQLVEEVGIEQTGTNTTIIKPQNQGPPLQAGQAMENLLSRQQSRLDSLNPCLNWTYHHVANEHYIHAEMLHSPRELSGAGKCHLCQVC